MFIVPPRGSARAKARSSACPAPVARLSSLAPLQQLSDPLAGLGAPLDQRIGGPRHEGRELLATIGRSPGGFIAAARGRPDAELWEVTPSNREALAERVLAWLGQNS
jgi:hypothetical protein